MNTKVLPKYLNSCYTSQNNIQDPRLMEYMTYRNQITDPVPASDPPDLLYEYERHFLLITSAMRDRTKYTDPACFDIELAEPLRDVVTIELCGGTIPNAGNISGDGYLLLDITDLNHIQCGDGNKYFGILGLQYHPNRDFYNLDKSNTNDMPMVFKPVKSKLSKLSIRIRHPDGSLVTFGDEDPNQPANFALQLQLTFEIRCRVRRRANIDRDHRAIPHPMVM